MAGACALALGCATPAPALAMGNPPLAAQEAAAVRNGVLRFSGAIVAGEVRFNPVQASLGALVDENRGDYVLRLTLSGGQIIEQHFGAQIALGRDAAYTHFAVQLPDPGPLARVEVLQDGAALPLALAEQRGRQLSAAAPGDADLVADTREGQLKLTWNAAQFPWLQAIHVAADGRRQVLTLSGQGGALSLPLTGIPADGAWEISLSNGINTRLFLMPRR